eukprot:jgi/Orpsp1_1/1189590/evm.model.d7180000073082.1
MRFSLFEKLFILALVVLTNASIPRDIHFFSSSSKTFKSIRVRKCKFDIQDGKRREVCIKDFYYDTTDCRYNKEMGSVFCEIPAKKECGSDHLRIRFEVDEKSKCNLDTNNLYKSGNRYYFKDASYSSDVMLKVKEYFTCDLST